MGKRSTVRPRARWGDNVSKDPQENFENKKFEERHSVWAAAPLKRLGGFILTK